MPKNKIPDSRVSLMSAACLGLGLLQAGPAFGAEAPPFSYVFVAGGYENRHVDQMAGRSAGPVFAASLNLSSHLFLDADYALLRSQSFERPGAAPSSSGSVLPGSGSGQAPTVSGRLENQSWSLGLGSHLALTPALDLEGSASYLRNHVVGIDGFADDVSTQGWSASAGLRYRLIRWLEVDGGLSYADIEGNTGTTPFAGAVINLNRTWSLAATHSWTSLSRSTAVTLRASFDTNGR